MMKKIYFAILILVLALSVSAFTDIPSPPGRGTYFESGDNATFSYVTANNLPDRLPVENIQNLYPHSFEFGQWDSNNFEAFEDLGTYQLLTQDPAAANGLLRQNTGEAGKRYTITVKCILTSPASGGEDVRLYQFDGADDQEKYFTLPLDKETTIQWTTPDPISGVSDFGINNEKSGGADQDLWALKVLEVSLREFSYAKIMNFGASVGRMAKEGANSLESFGYANLYAEAYSLEMENFAVDGDRLANILADMHTELDDLTYKIPIIFLGGGGNNITDDDTADEMFVLMAQMIALARTVSPHIVVNLCEEYEAGMSAGQIVIKDAYNALVVAAYPSASNPDLTLIEPADALGDPPTSALYAADQVHPNIDGQEAWFNLIDSTFTFPKELVDTVSYTETSRDIINVQSELTKLATPKYITVNTISTIPISASNWVVFCDTDTAGGEIGVTLPEGFNKDNVTVINMGSTHNVNITSNGSDAIYGISNSPTTYSFGMGKVFLQFNPFDGWW